MSISVSLSETKTLSEQLFPFELSPWQKLAMESIDNGNNSLITAPTGSGKTLPAEYAIKYFTNQGKKVIYTSPIKALSNQKYFDLSAKYPDISFGILTGDIKDNAEADVLIMTTEILCNYLHHYQEQKDNNNSLDFNINLQTELGCVIFDEVHYINDADRGTVWEESLMLMPKHIQLVMLSATIAGPEKFAHWLETINETKKTIICSTENRAVPLKHYLWFAASEIMVQKKFYDDKEMYANIKNYCNKLNVLYDTNFDDKIYYNVEKLKDILEYNHVFLKRNYILNSLVRYLNENNMLPGICFVYSRKNVEVYAKEITCSLIDSQQSSNVEKECRHIITKFDNYSEYMKLPEYNTIITLLKKGVGIHHSGLIPVFREMIELMFTKGYIKLLFATETFAVGLNMPTKTVIFTNLQKFDGHNMRYLYSHEYTQQAGRAGRRGYDTIGHVIHLANLFKLPDFVEYKKIMNNKPQTIVSKFKISYPLILKMNNEDPIGFIKNGIIHSDILNELSYLEKELADCREKLQNMREIMEKTCTIPIEKINYINELRTNMSMYKNKMKKMKMRELETFYETYKKFNRENEIVIKVKLLEQQEKRIIDETDNTKNYIMTNVDKIKTILNDNYYFDNDERHGYASKIKEVHPLVFTDTLLHFSYFEDYTIEQIVGVFACFTTANVNEENKKYIPSSNDEDVKIMNNYMNERYEYYYAEETKHGIFSGSDYNMNYDMSDICMEWCDCEDENACIELIKKNKYEKGLFVGEFVKAILKINAIVNELIKINSYCINPNLSLQHKLSQIPSKTLKFICTSQSLYV